MMLRECRRLASTVARTTTSSRRHCFSTLAVEPVPTKEQTNPVLNKFSSRITQPKSQGASQAMLHATGLSSEDMNKAQVGISSVWFEGNPCNMHLLDLAQSVKEGVRDAGLVGFRFNTIGVSDGISMGTSGMCYSMQSRDLIADSIETVMSAQWYDANIALPGCDKNMPGVLIAMARVNRPSLVVYGGTIRAGCARMHPGQKLDIVSAFQSYGSALQGKITEEERVDIVQNACPGQGACGGMYTANTMAVAIETLGMSVPYSSSAPANSPEKVDECRNAGKVMRNLLELDLLPKDILTREAFDNAMTMISVLGGSTNAVLHLLAVSRAAGVPLELDDFQRISDKTPLLADLKPSGRYVMEDLHAVGGTPAVMKLLLEHGFLNGDCITVTGKTLAENVENLPPLRDGQDVIVDFSKPIKPSGHLQILSGSLAPKGAVAKITGKEGLRFSGPARVFNSEEDMIRALEEGKIKKGDAIVIRYEGPVGGPGMPEMLLPTSAIMGAGLGDHVAMITDGRFSGGSHGFIVGHVTPEAQLGGPIGLVRDGDIIKIDAESNTLDLVLDDAEIERRRCEFKAPALKATRGTLYKYIKNVSDASKGCVTDE